MARLVGLDIGSTTIKVVELENNADSHRLIAAGLSATPPRGLLSEASLDQAALADAIKKTMADAKITTKQVNIALPENLVYTRVVEMPTLSEKELASAIRWEAEQYIPLPLSDVVLDYQVMNKSVETPAGPKMEVFLVAAPTALITKFQKIVGKADLDLFSIETEALSLARALIDSTNVNPPVTLVISLNAETTSVFIAKGSYIILTYIIPSGSRAFTRALSADLGIDQMQAEEYKKTYGLKKEVLSGKVGNTFKPVLDNILSELKRTVSFYQSKNAESPIARVVLASGSAKLPGLVVYIAEGLGIETQIGDPWQKVTDSAKLSSLPYDPILFAQAVGLALKPH